MKIRSRILLLTSLFFLALPLPRAQAILNIEALRLKMRHEPSAGSLSASYEKKDGNTEMTRFKLAGQGMWRNDHFENLAAVEREFGETNGIQDANREMEHLRTNWLYKDDFSYEAYGQLEKDQFRRLSFRGLVGLGIRQRWADSDKFVLFTGAGAFWSRETLGYAPNTSDAGTNEIYRGNVYVSFNYLLNPQIDLSSITYWQPDVSRLGDARILNTTLLTLHVTAKLAVGFNYSLSFDSRPPQMVNNSDQDYMTSITLTL